MNQDEIIRFIRTQKVAVVAGVDEDGFPSQKAMFAPRRIDGRTAFYFSTNTSSQKVQIFRTQPKASVYFYKQGKQKFVGIQLKGTMEVLTDHEAKASIWQPDGHDVLSIGSRRSGLLRLKIHRSLWTLLQ